MHTIWIEESKLNKILSRHEAFWQGTLEEYPLMWIVAPECRAGVASIEPDNPNEKWTNVDIAVHNAEAGLSRTHFAGDALPVYMPWLGPDQFAAWLGSELELRVKDSTSWAKPFVNNWSEHETLRIAPDNYWWRLYLETFRRSIEAGRNKWITAYPDLHTGIDGLAAIRGLEKLLMDLIAEPETIQSAMRQMTELWKYVVDVTTDSIEAGGQGASNWTMGWSEKKYLCIGQNDTSCMISPEMFSTFCLKDTIETANYVDYSIYHLDGPGAFCHLDRLLEIDKLACIQLIQGAGKGVASDYIDLLMNIQNAGKSVQVFYAGAHAGDADLFNELDILCSKLDYRKLFFWAIVDSSNKAEALVNYAKKICYHKT